MCLPEICKAGFVRSSFSEHFRSWRSRNGKPLKTVAQELGVGITTVSQWELGLRFPTAENLEAIAQYTGIPPCRFFCPDQEACARLARLNGILFKRKSQTCAAHEEGLNRTNKSRGLSARVKVSSPLCHCSV